MEKTTLFSIAIGILSLFALVAFSPEETGTIKGTVVSSATGEALPFVNVMLNQEGKNVAGSATDIEGRFIFKTVTPGAYDISAKFMGYKNFKKTGLIVDADSSTIFHLKMQIDAVELPELEVTSEKIEIKKEVRMSSVAISRSEITRIPSVSGTRGYSGKSRSKAYSSSSRAKRAPASKSDGSLKISKYYADEISIEEPGVDRRMEDTEMDMPTGGTIVIKLKEKAGGADLLRAIPGVKGADKKAVADKKVVVPNTGLKAGTLTAGEVHDFSKWHLWTDISKDQLKKWQTHWKIAPQNRYSVQITNKEGMPIIDQRVQLLDERNEVVWTARTDNTGKAELWANMFDSSNKPGDLSIQAEIDGKKYDIKEAKGFHKGINYLSVPRVCTSSDVVDIAFVVDATGSMGDEIKYLKTELYDVIQRVQAQNEELTINLGSVFYRDHSDDYLTRESKLTPNIEETVSFISMQSAGGGGDFPEAVDAGLESALNNLKWSESAKARILFLVLDAPPHNNAAVIKKLQTLVAQAAEEGIRIVPVTASGINKSTEYLMRALALATNGTYTFLTDHSGIGGSHIKPTTDEYKVEKLNDNCPIAKAFLRLTKSSALLIERTQSTPAARFNLKNLLRLLLGIWICISDIRFA